MASSLSYNRLPKSGAFPCGLPLNIHWKGVRVRDKLLASAPPLRALRKKMRRQGRGGGRGHPRSRTRQRDAGADGFFRFSGVGFCLRLDLFRGFGGVSEWNPLKVIHF